MHLSRTCRKQRVPCGHDWTSRPRVVQTCVARDAKDLPSERSSSHTHAATLPLTKQEGNEPWHRPDGSGTTTLSTRTARSGWEGGRCDQGVPDWWGVVMLCGTVAYTRRQQAAGHVAGRAQAVRHGASSLGIVGGMHSADAAHVTPRGQVGGRAGVVLGSQPAIARMQPYPPVSLLAGCMVPTHRS